jgi:hypothetical protein
VDTLVVVMCPWGKLLVLVVPPWVSRLVVKPHRAARALRAVLPRWILHPVLQVRVCPSGRGCLLAGVPWRRLLLGLAGRLGMLGGLLPQSVLPQSVWRTP